MHRMARILSWIVISFVYPIVLSGCLVDSDSEDGKPLTIYGFVTDYKTSQPIQGAEVILYDGANEVARSQTTGSDGRYELILENPTTVDYSSFYVKASGYDAISTLGLNQAIHLKKNEQREIDLSMFDREAFPIYFSSRKADMVDYSYLSSITLKNWSDNYYNNLVIAKYTPNYVNNGYDEEWSVTISLAADEEYQLGAFWMAGDRYVISTMGMSKSYFALTDCF